MSNPAVAGSIITLYATGEGKTTPDSIDGRPAEPPLSRPNLPVRAFIGGIEAEVVYAGGAPGIVAGVMQVNVRLPNSLPAGHVEAQIAVGNFRSQLGVTVAVRN